ncbi:ABC-type glycine betaine transport system substrate-binding domain-containing protein [Cupriavidus necator]|uniref:glycine betaine ABC transporter substrate-binding protein n=1 Tax=Cupriavidus necator TaxID=106590 RepID=UPI003F73F111
MLKRLWKSLGVALALCCGFGPVHAQSAAPITMGQINLTFYVATGAVIQAVLEDLGHGVKVTEGNHPAIYDRLGKGEVDMLVASWLPHAHGKLQAPLASQLVEAATLYEGARLYWAVPAHVPASVVRSVDDLKKPDVIARMDKEIVGVGPGSGLMVGSAEIMQRYGLESAGYQLKLGKPDEWAKRLANASASGKWMVMPLWQPQYLNALYPVRVLDEPAGIFGTDRAVVVVRKAVWESWPARTRTVVSRIQLGIPVVTDLERQIVVDRKPPAAVARDWMKANPEIVRAWFAS